MSSPGPYPAPVPLQVIAIALGLLGAGGVILALLVLEAAIAVIRHNSEAVAVNSRDVTQVALTDFPPLTAVVILICAVLSLAMAAMVVGRRRWRWRVPGFGIGLAALLDACMIVSLATALGPGPVQPAYTNPAPVLHPDHFIQSGAIGQPTPGQPDHPATIDRLLADGAATYLQYHIADVAHDGQPTPLLIDDHGRVYQVNVVPTVYTTPAGFMRELMPWRAPVQELAAFPPLAPGVRAVTVRFQDNMLRVVQTVHLVLNHPLPTIPSLTRVVRLPGIAMTLHFTRGRDVMRLSISTVVQQAVAPRGGIVHLVPAGLFLLAHGRVLMPLNWDATCQPAIRGPQRCETWATFARLPSGTRLVATAHGLTLYDQRDRPKGVAAPYRVSFVVP